MEPTKWDRIKWRWWELQWRIIMWRKALICRIIGHDWEDVSVAGPDSGDMAVECKRCDRSHSTTLY